MPKPKTPRPKLPRAEVLRRKAAYERKRRATLKSHSICTRCGCEAAESGRTNCRRCKDEVLALSMRRYYDRKEQGHCTVCDRALTDGERIKCAGCRRRHNRNAKRNWWNQRIDWLPEPID